MGLLYVKDFTFYDNTLIEGGEVVSHKYFLILISVRGLVNPWAMVWQEGLGKLRNSITLSGLEPTTFQLVAERFNQLRHLVLH
jgi:hypothetical protein